MLPEPFEQGIKQTECTFCHNEFKVGDYVILLIDGPVHFGCYIMKTTPYYKNTGEKWQGLDRA